MKQQRKKKSNDNKRKLVTTGNDKDNTNNNGIIDTQHHHIHHHSQHDNTKDNHGHAHHHDTNHQHGVDSALKHIQDNLRGANIHIGDERKLQQGSSQSYNYQVDLYIEIDQAFVNLNQGVLEHTVDYLNAIVTGAVSFFLLYNKKLLMIYALVILCLGLFGSYLFLSSCVHSTSYQNTIYEVRSNAISCVVIHIHVLMYPVIFST